MDFEKSTNSFGKKKTLPEYLFDNFFYQFVNNFLELL